MQEAHQASDAEMDVLCKGEADLAEAVTLDPANAHAQTNHREVRKLLNEVRENDGQAGTADSRRSRSGLGWHIVRSPLAAILCVSALGATTVAVCTGQPVVDTVCVTLGVVFLMYMAAKGHLWV